MLAFASLLGLPHSCLLLLGVLLFNCRKSFASTHDYPLIVTPLQILLSKGSRYHSSFLSLESVCVETAVVDPEHALVELELCVDGSGDGTNESYVKLLLEQLALIGVLLTT